MNKKHAVTLTDEERWPLRGLVSSGEGAHHDCEADDARIRRSEPRLLCEG